jgi:hypothetical protein
VTEHRSINPVSEPFFATLEEELLALQPLQCQQKHERAGGELHRELLQSRRLHSQLDYASPSEFETSAPSGFKQSNLSAKSGNSTPRDSTLADSCPQPKR